MGYYIVKTPLWAIQHCLSINNPSMATYTFDVSNLLELCNAADGAFVICGFVNPNCNLKSISKQKGQLTLMIQLMTLTHPIVVSLRFQLLYFISL